MKLSLFFENREIMPRNLNLCLIVLFRKKYSNKLSMKALVEKSMLRKIKKREEQISTLPSFTLISQGNPKELKETQGN